MVQQWSDQDFESWLRSQPEEICRLRGKGNDPISLWTGSESLKNAALDFDFQGPKWVEWFCYAVWQKPIGVRLWKAQCLHWLGWARARAYDAEH